MTEQKNDLPLQPCGWFLLVEEKRVAQKTAGGIILASETQDAERYLTTTGRVVAMGPACYTAAAFHRGFWSRVWRAITKWLTGRSSADVFSDGKWCEIGDTVMFHKHAGYRIELKADDPDDPPRYRLLKDNDLFATVSDPDKLRGAVT